MEFGGYVAFTDGGYKCLAFGSPPFFDVITLAKEELDIPQSFALRSGRYGFRRSIITKGDTVLVLYSAFFGVAEQLENRAGSFLSMGVAFQREIDCVSGDIGRSLVELLADLAGRVSDGSKFTKPVTKEVVNEFLAQNSPVFEAIRDNSIPTKRKLASERGGTLALFADSGSKLPSEFNAACVKIDPHSSFFIFEKAAESELSGARHSFRFASWPIRAVDSDIKIPAGIEVGPPEAEIALPSRDVDQFAKVYDRLNEVSDRAKEALVAIEEKFKKWRLFGAGGMACLLVLALLNSFFIYYLNSTLRVEQDNFRKQLKLMSAIADNVVSLSSRKIDEHDPAPPTPAVITSKDSKAVNRSPPVPVESIVDFKVPNMMNILEIRTLHCQAMKDDRAGFEREFARLNKRNERLADIMFRRNEIVVLPLVCRQ